MCSMRHPLMHIIWLYLFHKHLIMFVWVFWISIHYIISVLFDVAEKLLGHVLPVRALGFRGLLFPHF